MRSSCAEFASNGLEGARIEEIARKAGTSKQLVYYYFGNKTGLYRATLEDISERLIRIKARVNLRIHILDVENRLNE